MLEVTRRPIHVYVAGPMSIGDLAINIKRGIDAGSELIERGFIPFIPHLSHFVHMIHPQEYETWMEQDFAWLKKCDAVLRLRGESRGADLELDVARENGIPIFYTIPALAETFKTDDNE